MKNKTFSLRKARKALALLLLVAMMLPALASAATAYVNTSYSGLNLRDAPSTSGNIITSFPRGTQVQVLRTYGGWAYVSVGGYVGYMSNSYLTSVNPSAASNPYSGAYSADGVTYMPLVFSDWSSYRDWVSSLGPAWGYGYRPLPWWY